MSTIARPPIHRWTYNDWGRLVGSGALDGQRVELIDGEIIDMSPPWEPHVAAVTRTSMAMRRAFDESIYWIRVQAPLRLGRDSDPDPDIAVVHGPVQGDARKGPPRAALIVIEVAESSLKYDRGDKASLYASAEIADYWIVNLVERNLEIHRTPVKDAQERFGFRYSQITILKPGESIAPLAAMYHPIAVADIVP